jgi:hypothetical protein
MSADTALHQRSNGELRAAWFCDMSAESRKPKARKQEAGSRKQEAVGRWRYKPLYGSYLRSAFCFFSRKFIPSKV